jgi:hypothetical protein
MRQATRGGASGQAAGVHRTFDFREKSRVPGVRNVIVSFPDKTAVVTYDDAEATLDALTAATTNAGYPSALKSEPGRS